MKYTQITPEYVMKSYVQNKISFGIVIEDDQRIDELENEYQPTIDDLEQSNNIVERKDSAAKYAV